MRLIDADVLKGFIENRYEITWENDYEGGIKDACVDILHEIEKMPSAEPNCSEIPNNWIPCTPETMPKEAGAYICTCKDGNRNMVTMIKWQPRSKLWNLTGARTYWKVSAWMPLPTPFKPKEDS